MLVIVMLFRLKKMYWFINSFKNESYKHKKSNKKKKNNKSATSAFRLCLIGFMKDDCLQGNFMKL